MEKTTNTEASHKNRNSTLEDLPDITSIIDAIDDNTKLLRLHAVEEIVGFKSTHIYQLIKDGEFPKPIKLGKRQALWLSTQITDWKKRIVKKHLIL